MKKIIYLFELVLCLTNCAYNPVIDTAGRSGTFNDTKAVEITNDLQHCKTIAKNNTTFNGNIFYWTDIKRGAVIRLSSNGLEKISDAGMKDYFRDISEELMTKVNHLKIFGGYDSRYD